ncbi:hypothetical protein BGZ65_005620, partial [Modicella reniformis]
MSIRRYPRVNNAITDELPKLFSYTINPPAQGEEHAPQSADSDAQVEPQLETPVNPAEPAVGGHAQIANTPEVANAPIDDNAENVAEGH